MIQFLCPRCSVTLSVPDSAGGQKTHCPQCGQRLQVPLPPPNKTMLAPLVSAGPPSPITPSAPATPDPPQAADPPPAQGATLRAYRRGSSAALWLTWLWVGGVLALAWFYPPRTQGALVALCVVGGVVAVGLCALSWALRTACPACGRLWARRYLGESVAERKECYGLVTRSAWSTSGGSYTGSSYTPGHMPTSYSGSDSSSGSTSWEERVPVIRTTYRLHYECCHCLHLWEGKRVEQVEDFDRP